MPYIPKGLRKTVDSLTLKELFNTEYQINEGELNYIFSKILKAYFLKNKNYATANKLLGVIEAVKQEFYRRQVAPYEDLKIKQNGDI